MTRSAVDTTPGGREDAGLLRWYRKLGQMRRVCPALRDGRFLPQPAGEECGVFQRPGRASALLCAVNRASKSGPSPRPRWANRTVNLGGGWADGDTLVLPPLECAIFLMDRERE